MRRFIRWLAKRELEQAFEAGVEVGKVLAASQAQLREALAYANGEGAGRQQMFDHIDGLVQQRIGGGQDFVMPEDLARAKKGLLH